MPNRKAWEVAYRRERDAGAPGRYVAAGPTRDRLARLAAAHVPLKALARASGLSDTALRAILDGRRLQVQRATARRVALLTLTGIFSAQATGHVPRIGAVRRIRALMAMGWSHAEIAAAGAPNSARLINGAGHLMTAEKWRAVRDVYDKLSMTSGPSPETRGWARSLGYPPPLAWDDDTIDDATAVPQHDAREDCGDCASDPVAIERVINGGGPGPTSLTPTERVEVVATLASNGRSDLEIADGLQLSRRTIQRHRAAHGVPPGRQPGLRDRWAG